MTGIDVMNLAIGLAALIAGLGMLGYTLKRHQRTEPRGVAMLIAAMMVAAFGLFITAFAIAFAAGEPVGVGG